MQFILPSVITTLLSSSDFFAPTLAWSGHNIMYCITLVTEQRYIWQPMLCNSEVVSSPLHMDLSVYFQISLSLQNYLGPCAIILMLVNIAERTCYKDIIHGKHICI